MTEELKQKLREGRERAKAEGRVRKPRKSAKAKKIVVFITGKEKDSYDFFKPIRLAYREVHNYKGYLPILKGIQNPSFWENPLRIKNYIEQFCDVRVIK